MKSFAPVAIATAFVFSSGFLKKGEDGGYSLDTAAAGKTATEALAAAGVDAGAYTDAAIAKIKEAAAKISVPKEQIIAGLGQSYADLKQKAAGMDPVKIVAYLGQYSGLLEGAKTKAADYTQQLMGMKWTDSLGEKGKDIKTSLQKYTTQFANLKEQASVYLAQLKALGLDPAALGIDLSAYGL